MSDLLLPPVDVTPHVHERVLILDCELLESPMAQPRADWKILHRADGTEFVNHYDPKSAVDAKARLGLAMRAALPRGFVRELGPVAIWVEILRPMPKGIPKKDRRSALPYQRPDFDNYVKLLCDAFGKILWHDDAQVVGATVLKRYAVDARGVDIEPRWRFKMWRMI